MPIRKDGIIAGMDDLRSRVETIQAEMVDSAKSCFDDSDLSHLRAVIRLTVEFHHYLEHGSTKIAGRLLQEPHAGYFADLEEASTDPFNKYDLEYLCESTLSGIDSFCDLNANYRILVGATSSSVKWGMFSSRDSFKDQFASMFKEFAAEANFENKCRLLLDLFKLQIIFMGISYE